MKLLDIYKCLCDETRVRILGLLSVSPLCVCHIQAVLRKSQVIVSQHLGYLRERGLVTGQRYRSWMIYSLTSDSSEALDANLRCIQNAGNTDPQFRKDRERLEKLMGTKNVQALLDEGYCPCSKVPSIKPSYRKETIS
ncbi:MAG: ArsR/SmtB family transcription factor [Chthoniobacteraceae bacterium]